MRVAVSLSAYTVLKPNFEGREEGVGLTCLASFLQTTQNAVV